MGSSESILRHEAALKTATDKLDLEQLAVIRTWPQNARGFSGKPLPGMVYVAIVYDDVWKQHKPWLAFDTRDEAEACLGKYHGAAKHQPLPFVYQKRAEFIIDSGWASYKYEYWISVVPRAQAREAGLYCEVHEENANSVEGEVPTASAPAPNI